MKQKVRRISKSTLSVILTLCMIMSCFTVGLVATDAAKVQSESTGISDLNTVYFDNSVTNWSTVYLVVCKSGGAMATQMSPLAGNDTIFSVDAGQWNERTKMLFVSSPKSELLTYNTSYDENTPNSYFVSSGGHYTDKIICENDDADDTFYVNSSSDGAPLYRYASRYAVVTGEVDPLSALGTTTWDTEYYRMNYDGSSSQHYYIFKNVAAGNYAFKIQKNGLWASDNTFNGYNIVSGSTGCTISDNNDENHVIKLELPNASDVKIILNSSNSPKTIYVIATPLETTQTVTGVASPSAGGTVTPASAFAGENLVKATFTAAASSNYTFTGWTLGENLVAVDGTSTSSATIKLNVLDDADSTAAHNTATANFNHSPVTLNIGTRDRNWAHDAIGTFVDKGNNIFEFDTENSTNASYKSLTSGQTYYLYVATEGANETSGTYYKGAGITTNSSDNYSPYLTTSTPANLDAYTASSSANYGGRNGTIPFQPDSSEAYTFVFDAVNKTISVRNSIDPTQPLYSLSGNVTDKYIVDSPIIKPKNVDTSTWWATYHEELAIDEVVGNEGDGVFKIIFTTENYAGNINVGLAGKNGKQYAFNYNNHAYNTNGDDLDLTDAGIGANGTVTSITDGLYVYPSVSGGSLKLKPSTTYTITIDQTEQYDNITSNPYGKITIDWNTVYASATAMKQDFDVSLRRYKKPEECGNTIGTATVKDGASGTPTDRISGSKGALDPNYAATLVDSTNYTFAGWYTDPECTVVAEPGETFNHTDITVAENYYALFKQKQPSTEHTITLSITNSEYGTVTPVSGAMVTTTTTLSAYDGATAVINAIPKDADSTGVYELGATSVSGNCTLTKKDNQLTLANITGDVTLNIEFTKRTTYQVTIKGVNGAISAQAKDTNNADYGSSVTAPSGGSDVVNVPAGGTVVLTAGTADTNYQFSSFVLEAGKYKRASNQSTSTSPMTIQPTNDMTAEALFVEHPSSGDVWLDFTGSSPNLYFTQTTGVAIDNFSSASETVYHAVLTLNNAEEFYIQDSSNTYKFNENPEKIQLGKIHYASTSKDKNGKFDISQKTTFDVYLKKNPSDNNEYMMVVKSSTSSDSSDIPGFRRIFAMDGTEGGTASFGDTVITSGPGLLQSDIIGQDGPRVVEKDKYNIYYFDTNKDDPITIRVQTTIADHNGSNSALGVRAFVYNGKSVEAYETGEGTGVYYADITFRPSEIVDINNGYANNPILEIIPVYYNTKIADSNFIKFYVDANSMENRFGYNIGYYSWCVDSNKHEVDEGYPGQPLLKEGTKYYTYIPKGYVANNASTGTLDSDFSGVLLDNLIENSPAHEEVLKSWGCDTINYQTFDYEDPSVIANLPNVDTIEFVAHYEDTDPPADGKTNIHRSGTHWYTYSKDINLIGTTVPDSSKSIPITAPDGKSRLNGYELLRDFDNNVIDIYGNKITENFNNSVFVVSVGNQTVNSNIWDTVWMVYSGGSGDSHTLIAKGNPASFIGVAAGSQLESLAGKTVYVNYEKFLDGGEKDNNSGDRIDGRWLYSISTEDTNARIRVATLGKNGDTLKFMTYAAGASGARIAYDDDSVDGITQENENNPNSPSTQEDAYGRWTTFPNRTTKAKAVLNQPNGYKIVGFYLMKSGVQGDAEDNYFSTSISDYDEMLRDSATVAKFTNARNNYIVAVVEPVPKANLHLTHEMYGGPNAHNGAGQFLIKAEVLNPAGVVILSTDGFVDGSEGYEFEYLNGVARYVAGDNEAEHYHLRVTVRTIPSGSNTLVQWYEKDRDNGSYIALADNASPNEAYGKGGMLDKVLTYDMNDFYDTGQENFKYTNLDYYSDIDVEGTVYVNHVKLSTSAGDGRFYSKAEVLAGDGTTVKATFDWTEGVITIPSKWTKPTSGNKIRISVKTVPKAGSIFTNTYSDAAGTTPVSPTPTLSGDAYVAENVKTFDVIDMYVNTGTPEAPVYEFQGQGATAGNEYIYYSSLTQMSKTLTIVKSVDYAPTVNSETSFPIKVEYWDAEHDNGDGTNGAYVPLENAAYTINVADGTAGSLDANGVTTIEAGTDHKLLIRLVGAAAATDAKLKVTENLPNDTKYSTPTFSLLNATHVDTSTVTPPSIAITPTNDAPQVTINNNIKRQNFTVTKIVDQATDPATAFSIHVTLDGNDIPNTYTYTVGGTPHNFSGGYASVTGAVNPGTTMTVNDVPVGAVIAVSEPNPGTGYSFGSISFTNSTHTSSESISDGTASFTVDETTAHAIQINNNAIYTFAVTKRTNIENDANEFKVKIQKSSDDSTYSDFVPTQAGDFSISGMDDADAYSLRWNDTNNVFTIKKDETLTVKKIPYGTYLTVQELEGSGNIVLYSYTPGANTAANELSDVTGGGKKVRITANKAVVLTNYKVQDVTINKTVNNSSINNIDFPISVTLTRPGESSAETAWMAQKGNSSASSTNLSSITLKNGESITLKDVPVNSIIRVTEGALSGSDLSDYTFVSAVATPSTGETTSNPSGETYVQFNLTDYSTSVTVTNKINDKTITVKKAIDAGTNTNFPIKVEYQRSNDTSSTWNAYYPGSSQNVFDSEGIAMITSGGEGVSVSIPSDAKIRVTEMVDTTTGDKAMPSGFTFEKMTRTRLTETSNLTTSGASYADTNSSDTTNGDIITVNNTQLRTVYFTKTTNVSTDAASEFKITVQKKAPGENSFSYVDSLLNSSDQAVTADANHKFTIHKGDTLHLANVVKGTQFIVTETDTTSSYTFTATDTGVTGVSGTDNPVINATAQTISFTANTTSNPIVTINNVSVDKPFTISKHVDVAVPSGGSFKIKLWKKALGASAFVPYASANGFDANGEQRITPGTDISITAQPVGTQFYLEEITNDASNPVGYNYDSIDLSGLTEISLQTLPSGAGSSGKAFEVADSNSQTATINNIKKSQLIVTKSIVGDTANKQFPVVIKKWNTSTNAYDIDITDQTAGVTVTDSSDNTLSGRYDNGAFFISNGDKIKVDAVKNDKFKVIENTLSGNDYRGYEFVSYRYGTTTETTQADGQIIEIGDNSVTETVTNRLKTKTLKLKKTVDYPYATENSFPITIEYYDNTLTTPAYQTATTVNLTPSNSFTDVTLSGKAAVSDIRVSESTTGFVNYDPNLTTIKVDTADAQVLTSKEITDPADNTEVTIANYAKKANVKVYKDVINDDSDTQTFPITVNYTVPGANSAQTRTATIAQTGEIDLGSLPVGTQITVSEDLTGISGYTQGATGCSGGVTYDSTNSCYVSGTTNGTITVNNTRDTAGFTIQKLTNINNTVDEFKIKIWTADSLSGEWTPYVEPIGTFTANTTEGDHNGEYTIKKDSLLTITELLANKYIKVQETDGMTSKYSSTVAAKDNGTTLENGSNTTTGIVKILSGGSQGIVITNSVKTTTVNITKTVNGGASGANKSFPITVKITDESSAENVTWSDGTHTYADGADSSGVTITGGQTLTITGVPVGASVEVTEDTYSIDGYSFTSIDATGDIANKNTATSRKVTFNTAGGSSGATVTIVNTVATKDVVIKKNVTNSNKTDQAFTINVSLKLNGSGDSTTTTAWTYEKGSTSYDNASLTGISLSNGEYITLKAVPVGAYITVAEPSVPSGYSFVSIEAKHNGSTVIDSSDTSPYSFTLLSSYTDPEVTVNNKINDKTVKIKKVTDSSDGLGFSIKVEYKQSNTGADWTTVTDSGFTSGIASFAHDTEYTVSIPSDAQIKVSELNETGHTMPSGYEFEKFTKLASGDTSATELSTGVSGMVYTSPTGSTIGDGDTIIVNNTKLHEVKVTKTATGNPGTSDKFAFKLQKQSGSDWEDVDTLSNVGVGGAGTAFSTKVRKDTVIRVIEDGLNTAKYDFDSTTNTKVTTSGVTGWSNVNENGIYGITDITMPENKDVELTINNLVKTKNVTISKTANYTETQSGGAFGFTVTTKAEGAQAATACTYTYLADGTGSAQTFGEGGTVTITSGHSIVIQNVPIDTEVSVCESNKLSATTVTATVTGDKNSVGPFTGYENVTATFVVGSSDSPSVAFVNSKDKILTITKAKPSTVDDDINDTTTPFYIDVVETTNGTGGTAFNGAYTIEHVATGQSNTGRWDSTNHRFTIYMGESISFTVDSGDVYTVKEVDINQYYSLTGVSGSGDDITESSNVVGKTVTISTDNAGVTFTNTRNRANVTIQKVVLNADNSTNTTDTTTFTLDVTNGGTTTNQTITRAANVVISDVPYGTTFKVNESTLPRGYELVDIKIGDSVVTNVDQTITGDTTFVVTNRLLPTYSVKITKDAEDDAGSTAFGFKVTTANITYGFAEGTGAATSFTGTEKTFTLTDDGYVTLSGLLLNDELIIQETDPGTTAGYEFSHFTATGSATNITDNPFTYTVSTDGTQEVICHNIKSAPTEYSYQIKYIFPSRYDHLTGERKNGTQSFTRKGVLSADDEDFATYFSNNNITQALVLAKQPTESNFYMDMSISSIEIGDIPTGVNPVYTATAIFTDAAKTFTVHFRFPYEVDPILSSGVPGAYKPKVEKPTRNDSCLRLDKVINNVGYQSIPTVTVRETVEGEVQDVTHYTEAADTIIGSGGTEQKFRYWSIEAKNSMGDWVEVAKSGYRLYKYSTFGEYQITPIYDGDTTTANTTTINYLGATRNYWKMADESDKDAKGDRDKPSLTSENFVSADFDVSFQYQGKVIIEDSTAANYNTGVIIEKVGEVEERYALNDLNKGEIYRADYAYYAGKYAESVVNNPTGSWIENYLKDNSNLGGHTLFTNHTIAHNKLTNKNRTELGVSTTVGHSDEYDVTLEGLTWDTINGYTKKEALFRAYAYIYDTESKTILSLSTPVYYTLKNVAEMN